MYERKKFLSIMLGLVFVISALFTVLATGCKIVIQDANTSGTESAGGGSTEDFVGEKLSADEWNNAFMLQLGNFSMTNEYMESDGVRTAGAKCDFQFDGKSALQMIDADENTVSSDAEGMFVTYVDGECRGYICEDGVWTEESSDGIGMTGEELFYAASAQMASIGLFCGKAEAKDGTIVLDIASFAGFVFADIYADARYDPKTGTYTVEKTETVSGVTQTEQCTLRFLDKKIARIDYTIEAKNIPTSQRYGYGEMHFSFYDVGTTKVTSPELG